jgi:hypothetical protein
MISYTWIVARSTRPCNRVLILLREEGFICLDNSKELICDIVMDYFYISAVKIKY